MPRSNSPASSPIPDRSRPRALVILDVVVSVLLFIFAATFGLVVISTALAYLDFSELCTPAQQDGLVCNNGALTAAVYGLIAVTALVFFGALTRYALAIVRKRYGFWWPLAAIVLTLAVFYLATWIVGMTVPA